MPNVALVPSLAARIPPLEATVDGFPKSSVEAESAVGESPLESGATLTDHAVAKPIVMNLSGLVSDLGTSEENASTDRSAAAWEAIQKLRADNELVTVLHPFGTFPNMLVKSVSAQQSGRGMSFSMELVQVLMVGLRHDGEVGQSATGPAEERTSEISRGKQQLEPDEKLTVKELLQGDQPEVEL